MTLAWIYLLIAGVLEIGWAVGLKYTQGFTKLGPSIVTVVFLIGSMLLLAKAAETIPIGTAYAVWVGIGILGTSILGVFLFQEPSSFLRLFFLMLLLISVIGIKFTIVE